MSYELHVYLAGDRLPTRDEWQQALNDRGEDLILDEFSPREHTGFLPAQFKGSDSGFEYYYDSVNDDTPKEIREVIGGRDGIVAARLFSDPNEYRAATTALAVLAELSDGVLCDPQSGECVAAEHVFEWIKQGDSDERERRMNEALRKWEHLTERRCPECGAPCPEYRNRCAVCEFELGRV